MMKVTIVGAGELGATLAQKLAAADTAAEVVLLEPEKGPAQGKALDLLQSNPVLGSQTRMTGSRDFGSIDGSDYLVIADFGGSASEALDDSAAGEICAALAPLRQKPVVLVSQVQPVGLMSRIRAASHVPSSRIVGISPIALASTWRHHLGNALRVSPQDTQVSLLGAPPEQGLYEVCAGVDGHSLFDMIPANDLRTIARAIGARSLPGPRNLASSACSVLMGMMNREGSVRSCYIWLQEEYGARRLFACAPAVLGQEGLRRVLEVPLTPAQRVTMSRALDHLSRLQA